MIKFALFTMCVAAYDLTQSGKQSDAEVASSPHWGQVPKEPTFKKGGHPATSGSIWPDLHSMAAVYAQNPTK